jgi:hypothetical protein
MKSHLFVLAMVIACLAAPPAGGDTFTNRRTGQVITGNVLKRDTVGGHSRLLVRTPDGRTGWIWVSQWIITKEPKEKDREKKTTQQPEKTTQRQAPPSLPETELPPFTAAEREKRPIGKIWTDSTGRFSVEAEFVGLSDGQVTLKRQDGKWFRVALERLSLRDQDYVRQLTAPVAKNKRQAEYVGCTGFCGHSDCLF